MWLHLREQRGQPIDSVAVLPFVNEDSDPNTEHLSDGITEGIINKLSELPRLRILARSTVFRSKGRQDDPQRIGRDLSVRAVLTGRVSQRGGRLLVQTDLISVADGSEITNTTTATCYGGTAAG